MTIVATAIPKITDEFHSLESSRLVRLCFFPDRGSISIDVGEGVQVLSPEDRVLDLHCYFRTRQFDLCRCTEQHDFDHWQGHCWYVLTMDFKTGGLPVDVTDG